MSKHTEGPWEYDGEMQWVKDANGTMLMDVYGDSKDNIRANGLMSAAAPEMYEALTELLSWQSTAPQAVIDQCKAAITKAGANHDL